MSYRTKFKVGDMVVLNKENLKVKTVSDADAFRGQELYTIMSIRKSNYSGISYYLNKGADMVREDDLILWRSKRDISEVI